MSNPIKNIKYSFKLPAEEKVIQRNQTITTYYAQLYQREPQLYKWAGMAAFASFHIGKKMQMQNWEKTGIKSFAETCNKRNRSIEDDFQVIRTINNKIFEEIGSDHLAFSQMDFESFHATLNSKNRHQIIIQAFKKLDEARAQLKQGVSFMLMKDLIWEANMEILWHEQSEVVQPLFNKLSGVFSGAMTLFASFDYRINHLETSWETQSRFFLFMLLNGFTLIKKNNFIPELTNLQHRWYWIHKDVVKRWKKMEADQKLVDEEINLLAQLEDRNLII